VGPNRILFEGEGRNTREQALKVRDMLGTYAPEQRIMLVTSPSHIRRAVRSFRKVGFQEVAGWGAENIAVEYDMSIKDDELDDSTTVIPDAGGNISLRYVIWNNMIYLNRSVREYFALFYYWLRGWV
jgi:uncharacterized SAM-binding protein YcdF (DUF218 family)